MSQRKGGGASGRESRGSRLRGVSAVLLGAFLVLGFAGSSHAAGGVFSQTKHGNPTTGVYRDSTLPRGDCSQCHLQHDGSAPNDFALFAPDNNALCATAGCHNLSTPDGVYQGLTVYNGSSHGTSSLMVWPGPTPPARPFGDAGKCVNCHDPHGFTDSSGLIPAMAIAREENLCDTCHDGSPATKNIAAQFAKQYRHPVELSGRYNEAEDGNPASYGATNRHAECQDCHNPHVAKSDGFAPTPPNASNRILGVGRVAVTNGAAGTVPTYTYLGPADTTSPVREYQLCFKCHSSWTTLPPTTPSGGTPIDKALQFNPNNPSYHPVEAQGKNTNINPGAFVNGWNAAKLMYCTDCHTSDDTSVRGPHGSLYNYILKKDYKRSSSERRMSASELCFDCHNYDTYANRNASSTVKNYSRWAIGTEVGGGCGSQTKSGHTYHVDEEGYPCYACHDSHASTTNPHLIVTGRNPGLNSYQESANGGTCGPTCHRATTYCLNYPR